MAYIVIAGLRVGLGSGRSLGTQAPKFGFRLGVGYKILLPDGLYYLESCFRRLESCSGRIPTGFSYTVLIFCVFLQFIAVFGVSNVHENG